MAESRAYLSKHLKAGVTLDVTICTVTLMDEKANQNKRMVLSEPGKPTICLS